MHLCVCVMQHVLEEARKANAAWVAHQAAAALALEDDTYETAQQQRQRVGTYTHTYTDGSRHLLPCRCTPSISLQDTRTQISAYRYTPTDICLQISASVFFVSEELIVGPSSVRMCVCI